MTTRDKKRKQMENPAYELKKKKKRTPKSKPEAQPAILQMFARFTIENDGNCLFRAILYCLCSEDSSHMTLRGGVCDYLGINKEVY